MTGTGAASRPGAGAAAIEADRLDVRLGSGAGAVHAVRGVSFEIPSGAAFGLVGESGSGKSTVLRALAGLVPVTSGRARIEGTTMRPGIDRRLRARVQLVFQDSLAALHPGHTVDRLVREPLLIHGRAADDARIERALREVGLGAAHRWRYPHELSGGQRQRVAIARALALEPAILLLDEPTSALDVSIQAEILDLLTDIRGRRGLTILLVSHDLAVVAHLCERVAVMAAGQVIEMAGTDALRSGDLAHPHARLLVRCSRGYDAALARELRQLA